MFEKASSKTPRVAAQEVVYEYVNRRRGEASKHDWNNIHVVHTKGSVGRSWSAVVLVTTMSEMVFVVNYDQEIDRTFIDIFTKQRAHHYV